MKRLVLAVLALGLMQIPMPRSAHATPTIVYTGSIVGTVLSGGGVTPEPLITEFDWFFLDSLDSGSASSTSIQGFTSVADNTTFGAVSFTVEDVERDTSATVRTLNSIDASYGDFDAGPLVLDFGSGIFGTNYEAVARGAIDTVGMQVVPGQFDGSFNLVNVSCTTGICLDIFNELDGLTGNTGTPLVAFSGEVTGVTPFTGSSTISFTTTLVPVALLETIGYSGGPVDATLLGGLGQPGGIKIEFEAGLHTGDQELAALSVALTPAEVDDILLGTGETAAGIGILFAGGEAQAWEISFDGVVDGSITITMSYDDELFGADFDETIIGVGHILEDGSLETFAPEDLIIDPVANTVQVTVTSFSTVVLTAIPEPSSALLFASGLVALAVRRRSTAF